MVDTPERDRARSRKKKRRSSAPARESKSGDSGASSAHHRAGDAHTALPSSPLPDSGPPSSDETTRAVRPSEATFSAGEILGDRYRIVSQLGRGGMGDVWLAFDLKLKVEVALKSLRTDRFIDDQALELLRSEVRSARTVVSPNVCRIFDLVVEDGQELVSMEYVDGQTLTALLEAQGPLDLGEARPIASQLLAGLEAIHDAGLVHRDIKPENIMITRSGRVVIMDFGIAKDVAEDRSGTVSGTPAYMAPEQMRGEALDGRADVFAAGVVLGEMVSPTGIRERTSREQLWRGVREHPPQLPEGPWQRVLVRAVASDREERYASARLLARALEDVTFRYEGAEEKHPYPGLSSFTEQEAEFFFGREAEVEAIWKRLQQSHLLAVIGPSGVGKSSFLQAGLLPVRPEGWGYVYFHPGSDPFVALAHVLVPVFAGKTEAMQKLLHLDQIDVAVALLGEWRKRNDEALLVIDQFEELFTLNSPDEQAQFAQLLGRLVAEADVRVLVSMRDDFLYRCHGHETLEPLFREIAPIGPPSGASLRRAIVQPALACGYRFEDETLIDELLGHVGMGRGSLPLLAFALASLWEKRDRESGFLVRSTYETIGGVSGALAGHAEATLSRIGAERQSVVRELFRNLVTAEGTRATRDFDELLSVFEDDVIAREVLRELVDARLLTSFRTEGPDGKVQEQRVEIIHESLLEAWPRLVRWRTQDADSARLRDQLRQSARLWEERGRSEDLLWTGTAFQEYQVWRDRYPGGLTAAEEAFASAMVERAERQRRKRKRILTSAFVALITVLGVVATSLVISVRSQRRAEASTLFALAQLQTQNNSAALAYAIRSLELTDNPDVRRFALKSLWQGPTAFVLPESGSWSVDFSPDGSKIATSLLNGVVKVWSDRGGGPVELRDAMVVDDRWTGGQYVYFGPSSDVVVGTWFEGDRHLRIWSVRGQATLARLELPHNPRTAVSVGGRHLVTRYPAEPRRSVVQVWTLYETGPKLLTSRTVAARAEGHAYSLTFDAVDPTGTWLASALGKELQLVDLRAPEMPAQQIGRHEDDIAGVAFHPNGERIATIDSREIRIWNTTAGEPFRSIERRRDMWGPMRFDPSGNWLAVAAGDLNLAEVLPLDAPAGVDPLELRFAPSPCNGVSFDPSGSWIATATYGGTAIWPLERRYPRVLRTHGMWVGTVHFSADGRWIASLGHDHVLRFSSLTGDGAIREWTLPATGFGFAVDPLGRYVATTTLEGERTLHVIPIDGGPIRRFPMRPDESPYRCAIGPQGRFVAVGFNPNLGPTKRDPIVRLYDLDTGETRDLRPGGGGVTMVEFTPEGRLLIANGNLILWDLEDDTHETIVEGAVRFDLSNDGRSLLTQWRGVATFHDLESGESTTLTTHGRVRGVALDPTGKIAVTGDAVDGTVRVGPVTGEEPHLLLGHTNTVETVEVHPNGEWIASGGADGTFRIWPMPEGTPFHTLPYSELLDKLRALTNLRVETDAEAPSGYRIRYAEFPGWQKVPTW